MGVYDSVSVPCPECGKAEFFQSKGSDSAACRSFPLAKCPEDVLSNINRHSPHKCAKCGCYFAVDERTRTPIKAAEADWVEGGINSWYRKDPAERVAAEDSSTANREQSALLQKARRSMAEISRKPARKEVFLDTPSCTIVKPAQ